jgi:hypothetical protein
MRKLAIVGLVSAVLAPLPAAVGEAAALGTARDRSAESFVVRVWALNSDARYGDMWALMHPLQQDRLARKTFIKCSQKSYGRARDDSVTAIGSTQTSVAISGTRRRAPGIAVRFVLTSSDGRDYGPYTQNVVKVGEQWRWVMRGDDFRACPKLARS